MFQGWGNRILVLNSLQAINDLIEKRAHKYSNRPNLVFAGELIGLNQTVTWLPYGERWRAYRKLLHTALSPVQVKEYHSMQEGIAVSLCKGLLDKPEDFMHLVRMSAGRIIIAITYGIPDTPAQEEYISDGARAAETFARSSIPGKYLCDLLPFLKYAPSWVPFQREAREARELLMGIRRRPFEHVKRNMKSGIALPSLVQNLLSSPPEDVPSSEFEHRVFLVAGSMFGAGFETTLGTVLSFIMAMALNHDKQTKAQAEIDAVIGGDRLPTIQDSPSLPYVNAVIKETMRWQPAVPMGLPRHTFEDDVYGDYYIPKNTTILPNVWAIAYEANDKYDPEAFIPERFLDDTQDIPDPLTWIFGFGRRVCPGRYLAENSVFILAATILSTFDVLPPEDDKIVQEFRQGIGRTPKPYKCRIVPRSGAKARLIESRASNSNA
ncbi:cytochrome P450 [Obba rivulosa]|uniref:Cytochrome P450 n=1 Tax=Obba rivulosa TaxID=1052685 RepID=A0A8E2DMC6_9APHY|nr:cytochrome P450 [Obba rivulosa]